MYFYLSIYCWMEGLDNFLLEFGLLYCMYGTLPTCSWNLPEWPKVSWQSAFSNWRSARTRSGSDRLIQGDIQHCTPIHLYYLGQSPESPGQEANHQHRPGASSRKASLWPKLWKLISAELPTIELSRTSVFSDQCGQMLILCFQVSAVPRYKKTSNEK